MTTKAKPFRNKENYAKYLVLYFEPGLTVLLTTLEWCYNGQRPIEKHLAALGATKSLRDKNIINVTEQNTLVELKEDKTNLNDLDITLIYKIIQLTCNLLPRNNEAWTKACPTSRQGELEYLLFQLKDGRNKLAHPHDDQKDITDPMVAGKCKEMKDLLTKLLQAAALKGNIDLNSSEFNKVNKHIEDDVQRILKGENVCDSMSDHTLGLILTDLKARHFINDELKSTFKKEIEKYSAPSLKDKDGFQPLKDILQLNKSPVIVVQGEAGMGKTTMSRFLFYAWLSGNTDPVEELSSFDMVLRVDCYDIFSSDINRFYEKLLPSASFAFPNTNSLKRSLYKFKTLWIMDGYDECTKEFKGFLTDLANTLSENHKLLITTRPNTYKDLKDILIKCELSMTCLSLDVFQDSNVKHVIQTLIINQESKETFKNHFLSLDETAKHLLRTPLNLNLYIKLWKQDPELVTNTFTTKMLFLKTIKQNLKILKDRLCLRSSWPSEKDFKDFVKDWFYGSLCKQSFMMLMQGRYNGISSKGLDTLKKDARNSKLDPSTCLSTFLVQVKEYDEDEGESVDDGEEWENEEENEGEIENDSDDEESENDDNGEELENEGEDETKLENDGDGKEWENEEEDKEEYRYKYVHLTQQNILASLFLKYFKGYKGENVIKKFLYFPKFVRLIEFYVQMIKEDKSLDNYFNKVFSPIQFIINGVADIRYQSELWFHSSVASKFNVKYMEKVSQPFKDIPYLDIDNLVNFPDSYDFTDFDCSFDLTNLTIFLEFVRLQKIILSSKCYKFRQVSFQPLLESLIKSQLEIEIRAVDEGWIPYLISFAEFCGTFDMYRSIRNDNLPVDFKTICLCGKFDLEFYNFNFEKLKEYKTLEQLEIWITLDSISLPNRTNIIKKPTKEMIEITTLGLTGLNIDNFEKVLEELNKMKFEKTLKFKALHHDFEDISETDKRRLQKMAHTISIDFACQCKKDFFIAKIVKLNITSFTGDVKMLSLYALNAHHANLKSVFLSIYYTGELDRTLKFLRDYKGKLDEVKIELCYSFLELVNTENRTSANAFTIPQELVQRTSISISCMFKNFHANLTLLNNLRGVETLKFKAVYTDHTRLSPHQKDMLDQITGNLSSEDFKNVDAW